MDLEYRKKWDSFVKGKGQRCLPWHKFLQGPIINSEMLLFVLLHLDLREFEDADTKGIYWNVNFPFPMSNRDVSF